MDIPYYIKFFDSLILMRKLRGKQSTHLLFAHQKYFSIFSIEIDVIQTTNLEDCLEALTNSTKTRSIPNDAFADADSTRLICELGAKKLDYNSFKDYLQSNWKFL